MSTFFDALAGLFGADGLVPRRIHGPWPNWLVRQQVAGDALIWVAYVAVPLMIWRLGGAGRLGRGSGASCAHSRCSSACAG